MVKVWKTKSHREILCVVRSPRDSWCRFLIMLYPDFSRNIFKWHLEHLERPLHFFAMQPGTITATSLLSSSNLYEKFRQNSFSTFFANSLILPFMYSFPFYLITLLIFKIFSKLLTSIKLVSYLPPLICLYSLKCLSSGSL